MRGKRALEDVYCGCMLYILRNSDVPVTHREEIKARMERDENTGEKQPGESARGELSRSGVGVRTELCDNHC